MEVNRGATGPGTRVPPALNVSVKVMFIVNEDGKCIVHFLEVLSPMRRTGRNLR